LSTSSEELEAIWDECIAFVGATYYITCYFDFQNDTYHLTVEEDRSQQGIHFMWERLGRCTDRMSIMATEPEDQEKADIYIEEALGMFRNQEVEE